MANKQAIRLRLMEILGGPECADCGMDEFLLLDIHHGREDGAADRRNLRHRWEKYYVDNPGEARRAGLAVLCANCHRRRHRLVKPTPNPDVIQRKQPLTITIHLKPGSRMPTPEELAEFLSGLKGRGEK